MMPRRKLEGLDGGAPAEEELIDGILWGTMNRMSDHHSAYLLSLPTAHALPLVVDSPHSGTQYPTDFEVAVPRELLRRAEDTHVDKLYASVPRVGGTLIAAQFPRAYIDPNRHLEDIDEALLDEPWPGAVSPSRKTELGIGLVWRMLGPLPMYTRPLTVAEVQGRIERCWQPYHRALDAALHEAASAGTARWHLNVHSMPDDAYQRLGMGEKKLADFVLGNLDDTTCDEATMATIEQALLGHGYTVARNDPFKGVEIIRRSGQPQRGWHSLQIEVKRSLYMDERFEPHEGFDRVRAAIDSALEALAGHIRQQL